MEGRDLREVSELSAQLGYPVAVAVLEERFARIHANREHGLFVAEHEHRVVGWIHVHPQWLIESEGYAEIGGLVVDQETRRTGAGRALVLRAERWAREQSFSRLRVRSNVNRPEAHRFYPALGFTLLKTTHNYELSLD